MKTKSWFFLLAAVIGVSTAARLSADEIVKPTMPPAVRDDAATDSSVTDEPAVIDHVVYLAKLPTPAELIKAADAKGTPIERLDQTADRILAVYRYAGGRTVTFAYMLLTKAGSAAVPTAPQASNTDYSVVAPTPAPAIGTTTTVVYTQPEVIYYPRSVRYYDSAWDFWTPFAVGVGVGWFGGHSHGYSHSYGGWHGGRGWRH